MFRPLIAAALFALFAMPLLATGAASAAERSVGIGGFDRVRIDGAFDVQIAIGRSPRATLSGDAKALDLIDLRVEGTTLYLRRRHDDGATIRLAVVPVVVTLSAQTLASATIQGGGTLTIAGMRGERADLLASGTATIAVTGMDAQQANVSMIGGGSITLAGRAAHVRLSTNGTGAIDASALVADDLVVRIDGAGVTKADARYLATVYTSGQGRVVVTGKAKCTLRGPVGGVVMCGKS